jgi:chromosome segregation ATPase
MKRWEDLSEKINQANTILQKSHEDRASLLEMVIDSTKDMVGQREVLIEKSERFGSERDAILREARGVKRRHDGLKAKLEVLVGEGSQESPEVNDSREELMALKRRFKTLRERRDELTAKIEELDEEIEELDERIETRRTEMREEAFGSYQNIGKANRDISQSRAEFGTLENEMTTLFAEIGRFISTYDRHPSCAKVARNHRSLISQMHALRLSITLNNRLAGRDVPQRPAE